MNGRAPAAASPRLWPLFVSVFLVMAANGAQGTLLGLRATAEGFSGLTTGVIMACYFTGFLLGAPVTARAVGRYGHVRTFSALATLAALTAPVHGAWVTPVVWCALRLVFGFAMAGAYVVWENWLNTTATNANRGRLLARYMLSMMVGFAVGPLLLNLGEPTTYAMFLLPAAIMAAAVFPVWAAGGAAPAITAPQRASVLTIIRLAPTGMIGSVLIGMAHGGLVGMGAVYGKRIGLGKGHVALFLFAAYIGAVVTQVPLGWLYDHRSRRAVLGGVCAAIAVLAALAATVPMTGALGVVLMGAIGGLVFPLYGLTNAYVNHHVPDELRGAASGAFVQVCGVGAVAGPVTFALMMSAVGASGYFWMMVLAHVLLGGFIAARMVVDRRAAPAPALVDSAVG